MRFPFTVSTSVMRSLPQRRQLVGSGLAAAYRRLPGTYSSAESAAPVLLPPATSTLPSASSVAVLPWRGWTIFRVAVQVAVPGSYSSAAVARQAADHEERDTGMYGLTTVCPAKSR